jgi:hypothetical protein
LAKSPSGQAALGDDQPLLPFGDFYKAHFDGSELPLETVAPAPATPSMTRESVPAAADKVEEEDLDVSAMLLPKNMDEELAKEESNEMPTALPCKDPERAEETLPAEIKAVGADVVSTVADPFQFELFESMFSSPPCPEKELAHPAQTTQAWWSRPSVGSWLVIQTPEPMLCPDVVPTDLKATDSQDLNMAWDMEADMIPAKELDGTEVAAPEAAAATEVIPEVKIAGDVPLPGKEFDDTEVAALEAAAATEVTPELKIAGDVTLPVLSSVDDDLKLKEGGALKGFDDALALREGSDEFGVVTDTHAGM